MMMIIIKQGCHDNETDDDDPDNRKNQNCSYKIMIVTIPVKEGAKYL